MRFLPVSFARDDRSSPRGYHHLALDTPLPYSPFSPARQYLASFSKLVTSNVNSYISAMTDSGRQSLRIPTKHRWNITRSALGRAAGRCQDMGGLAHGCGSANAVEVKSLTLTCTSLNTYFLVALIVYVTIIHHFSPI